MNHNIIVVIPAYEPEKSFIDFTYRLADQYSRIVIIDDGSGKTYNSIFTEIEKNKRITVLRHAINMGKGRSLKDAFNYVLVNWPDAMGVVTADADGQHKIEDITRVKCALIDNPDSMILGCREFDIKDIPWRSKVGNIITKKFFSFLCGVHVSDTQTGLRGLPLNLLKVFAITPGERYEYETNMLLECNNSVNVKEVPIETIYESKDNHKTHFDPLRDSITIYKVILSYSFTSILATIIDFSLFYIFSVLGLGIYAATMVSRLIAAITNFLLNKNIVFKSKGNGTVQLIKYFVLVIVSGTISSLAIYEISRIIPLNLVAIKVFVETILFFFNYYVQRSYIFMKHKNIDKSVWAEDIDVKTDWDKYYREKKSWFSSFTQTYTLREIKQSIDKWVTEEGSLTVSELGGGNSCFAEKLCEAVTIDEYDVFDSNDFAVDLFIKKDIKCRIHSGRCVDLLNEDLFDKHYDFVYSIGLIEHFRGKDIETLILRHFECCKDGGVVLITFPTPTKKYRFVRWLMELIGVWKFYDEKPIWYEEVSSILEMNGTVLEHHINKKLPLTQEVVVIRKKIGDSNAGNN